jgi:RimJ/RimL family protein N-acetyltransferase
MIVVGHHVGHWVCAQLGSIYNEQLSVAFGMERDGELIAGVIFDGYNGGSIHMHVAGKGGHWMTREYARVVFSYAFDEAKVHKILGFVDSENLKARRYDEHLGFVKEAVIEGAGRHGDLIIYSMTREQCRYLGNKHGNSNPASDASSGES